MNQRSDNGFLKLLIGALLLLSAFAANAQSGDPVTIKSVDNIAGNSNVYTDKANTTVTVTELDADKKPVRSWTGTTDGEGKITIPAGSNLSVPYLRAKTADPKMAEFVLPSSVMDREPFMFAASGVLEGVVVDVKTVEGEVVATKKADKYGRVFLAAGLAAGTYILTAGDDRAKRVCSIHVSPNSTGIVVDPKSPLSLENDSYVLDYTKLGRIDGTFSNLDSLDLDDFASTRTTPILAGTTREIVFERPANLGIKPGESTLTVRDRSNGQSATSDVVFYSASAKLTNVKVLTGSETHLIVTVTPKELEGDATAHILSGPVTFENGTESMTMSFQEGQADFKVQSKPGQTGKFDVAWEISPKELVKKVWDPIKKAWEPVRKTVWEPLKKKANDMLWDPLKKGLKSGAGAPPKKDGDTKTEPPVVKKDDPPKVEDKKPEPPKNGGNTKATDDKWVKFDEDGRKGRKQILEDKDGYRREVKVYDDGGSELTTTRTGERRKTVTTETTTGGIPKKETEEFVDYRKDEKGEWVPETGERKTWEFDGKEKKLVKTEKWDKKSKTWK